MTDKIIKSRIQHKHDTEANWQKATNFIPKSSELIVYDPDENYTYHRFKFGDGVQNVNDLPFSSFSKSYNDLTDKPTIPSKAADIGALPNTTKIPTALAVADDDNGNITLSMG